MNQELIIYTDCSHYRKMGSWSVLFQFGDESMVISGICPHYIKTAVQGETYAVIKAVELAENLYPKYNKVKIYTDCIGLCYTLRQTAKPQKNAIIRMLQKSAIQKLAIYEAYSIIHVKSHQYKNIEECEASFYNNIVDNSARMLRHKTQNRFRGQKKSWIHWFMDKFIPYTAIIGKTYAFRILEMAYHEKTMTETKALVS